MNTAAQLTKRETEIAELIAWGATKKDVANRLFISEKTVENHTRNIYEKTGCTKVNELSAWWFCTHFHISLELSPLRRKILAIALLAILTPQILNADTGNWFARARTRTTTACRARSRRKSDGENEQFFNY